MYMRLTFNIFGNNFKAKECIEDLDSEELIHEYDEEYPNHLSFVHPKSFSRYREEEYEKAFLDYIIKNIATMSNHGAYRFSIFTEMYKYNDEQCNFGILNSGFYPYIWKYNISLPVSVYTIEEGDEPFM